MPEEQNCQVVEVQPAMGQVVLVATRLTDHNAMKLVRRLKRGFGRVVFRNQTEVLAVATAGLPSGSGDEIEKLAVRAFGQSTLEKS